MDRKQDTGVRPGKTPAAQHYETEEERRVRLAREREEAQQGKPANPTGVRTK